MATNGCYLLGFIFFGTAKMYLECFTHARLEDSYFPADLLVLDAEMTPNMQPQSTHRGL